MTAANWLVTAMDAVWRNAWTVIPAALLVGAICGWGRCRPATRHSLWLTVLLLPIAMPLMLGISQRLADRRAVGIVSPTSCGPTPIVEGVPAVEAADWAAELLPASTDVRTGPDKPHLLARGLDPVEHSTTPKLVVPLVEPEVARVDEPAAGTESSVEPAVADAPRIIQEPHELEAAPVKEPLPSIGDRVKAAGISIWRLSAAAANARWQQAVEAISRGIERLRSLMPPAPVVAWSTGTGILLVVHLAAGRKFRTAMRGAWPGPREVVTRVEGAARAVGLRRRPTVWMTDSAVSPMVAGVVFPKLYLPGALWERLDEAGRRAILVHELAHLRRGDQWVRLLETMIVSACWWHPIVWWARRRVREEAEICCDSWVTWLLPSVRRSYATALLQTQDFVGSSRSVSSAVGVGVVSVRARRFARRLTMVMTDSGKPRLSVGGVLVAVLPALLAFAGAPVFSCPPSENAKHQHSTAACDDTETPAPTADSYQHYLGVHTPAPLPHMLSTLYSSMMGDPARAPRARTGNDRDDLEARLDRLERQLAALSQQLSSLNGIRTPAPPALPRMPRAAIPPRVAIAGAPSADGSVVARVYRLNEGKLELLTQLMVRQDVPIRVRPVDGGIEIYATEGQHGVIGGFIGLIEPSQPGAGPSGATPRAIKIKPGAGPAAKERRAREKQLRPKAEASRGGARALEKMQEQVEQQLDQLHEKLEVLRESADALKEANRPETRAKMESIQQQMLAVSAEAAARQKVLQEIGAKMSAVEQAADALDDIAEARVDDVDDEDAECDELTALRDKATEQDTNGGTWYELGFALHSSEKYGEAIEAFQRSAELGFRKGDSLYNIACGYSLMGDADHATAWLKKAWDAGYIDRDHIKSDSDLDNIRNDARYKALMDSDD